MARKFISKRVRKGGMFPKQAERRIASNAKPLTLEEFNDYYKDERKNPGKAHLRETTTPNGVLL